jgi:hypothetical protein
MLLRESEADAMLTIHLMNDEGDFSKCGRSFSRQPSGTEINAAGGTHGQRVLIFFIAK